MLYEKKKIIYAIIGIIVLVAIIFIIAIISNKPMLIDHTPPEAEFITQALKKKFPDKKYNRLKGGEFLNEDTPFSKYSFINNNSIYIFNPSKLDDGEFEYKKVYDIDKNIKVMNIVPNLGSSVHFLDYNDTLYLLMDSNIYNKSRDNYDMFLDAIYEFHTLIEDYSVDTLGKKVDYDFMSTYVYSKDNILYYKNRGNERY